MPTKLQIDAALSVVVFGVIDPEYFESRADLMERLSGARPKNWQSCEVEDLKQKAKDILLAALTDSAKGEA